MPAARPSSRPLIPGITTSVTSRSIGAGVSAGDMPSALLARPGLEHDVALLAAGPSRPGRARPSSSSTSRMVSAPTRGIDGCRRSAGTPLLAARPRAAGRSGTSCRAGRRSSTPDVPAALLDDAVDRREPEAGALPDSLVVKNGSNSAACVASSMPVPVSLTVSIDVAARRDVAVQRRRRRSSNSTSRGLDRRGSRPAAWRRAR